LTTNNTDPIYFFIPPFSKIYIAHVDCEMIGDYIFLFATNTSLAVTEEDGIKVDKDLKIYFIDITDIRYITVYCNKNKK